MVAKRVAVWLLSITIGVAAGYATVAAFGTTVDRYAVDLNFGVLDIILNNFIRTFTYPGRARTSGGQGPHCGSGGPGWARCPS